MRIVEQIRFDQTPETPSGGVPLGDVIDLGGRSAASVDIPLSTLNRHALVAGATGSGKSQTVRHLLEGLHAASVPWLVIEPAKAEYAAMAGRLGPDADVAVIRLGDIAAVPLSLNPLEPEAGFPLQTHLDLVRALFLAAFEANEPFPQVLSQALMRCYTSLGWNLALSSPSSDGPPPRFPTLVDLQRTAGEVIDDIGYGAELAADVRGFVDVRLTSLLLGTPGRFLGGGHPLDMADLLSRNVVLELEDVGDDQDKAFCMGIVLIRLVEYLRVRHSAAGGSAGLRHVTVVEEAHRLLKATANGAPAGHAVEMFAGLLAEVRAYGEGIVVAEQIPSKLISDVVKNSALKILHRLPAADDREQIGATMNLGEAQSRAVVSLAPGQAVVFADGMDRPVLARIPLGEDRELRAAKPPTVATVGRRTGACGASCLKHPCDLREMGRAYDWVELHSELALWVELLTVAHLAGLPSPKPRDRSVMVAELSVRQLECVVAETVTRAVSGRARSIGSTYRPEALMAHLAEVAAGALVGREVVCETVETEWQAGRYRFSDVAEALYKFTGPADQPHPLTAEWASRGLRLRGDTIEAQCESYLLRPGARTPGTALLHGDGNITRLVAELSGADGFTEQLIEAAAILDIPLQWHRYIFQLAKSTAGVVSNG
ncbi:ATP-binding protein [Kribbella sp. NPDC056861]|uniref:ATP-binding protein n=1 Tax=Kribbella sp. NPDC056861 TaxID=3154857 RepID=UPI003421B11D